MTTDRYTQLVEYAETLDCSQPPDELWDEMERALAELPMLRQLAVKWRGRVWLEWLYRVAPVVGFLIGQTLVGCRRAAVVTRLSAGQRPVLGLSSGRVAGGSCAGQDTTLDGCDLQVSVACRVLDGPVDGSA